MGPDGERLGLPSKKFKLYLMRGGAPMSLKGFKEAGREREREGGKESDMIRFRF